MIEANYSYDHSTNSYYRRNSHFFNISTFIISIMYYYRRNSHFFNISTLIISIMYYNIQVTEANF